MERCDRISARVTWELRYGSLSWNSGRYVLTGVLSQSILPSATSSPMAADVNALVWEAIGATVYIQSEYDGCYLKEIKECREESQQILPEC